MAENTVMIQIQIRRDTTANWLANKDTIPAAGEPCFDLELGTFKIGDGVTTYGNLKVIGEDSVVDGESIELVNGEVTIKGFHSASGGQQPRINAAGNAIEWYTPDTSTVSGLADIVAGHTLDISNLQKDKADKATTLEGYGITDAMTTTAVNEAIDKAISKSGHASFKKVDTVPSAASAEDNVLYLVMNGSTGYYDIYAKVDSSVVLLDDTNVDLDDYSTTKEMNDAIANAVANKVDKVTGKGLSAEDFTTELKEKLDGVETGANKNLIEIVKMDGSALAITDKAVNIPIAGTTLGVVLSSTGENMVGVNTDGSMEVQSLNVNRLVQTSGDTLILDGGNAAS